MGEKGPEKVRLLSESICGAGCGVGGEVVKELHPKTKSISEMGSVEGESREQMSPQEAFYQST